MDDAYNNIDGYNPKRKRNILIAFDDMIADIMTNKDFQALIKELFIRCMKLNISLVFITESYFRVLIKLLIKHSKTMTKINSLKMAITWCMILCLTLIDIVCLIFMNHNQLTLYLIQ